MLLEGSSNLARLHFALQSTRDAFVFALPGLIPNDDCFSVEEGLRRYVTDFDCRAT